MKVQLALLSIVSALGCSAAGLTLEEAAAAYCEIDGAQRVACETEPVDADCATQTQACFELFRSEVRDPYNTCLEELACDAADDRCKLVGSLGLTLDDNTDDFHTACAMAFSGCGMAIADICYFEFGTVEANARLSACTGEPCDQIEPCLSEVLSVCERLPYSLTEG